MAGMSDEVIAVTHDEIVRRRADQTARVASVRARAAGVLGASGLAATLASAISTNSGFVLAVVCYFFATVYAIKSMTMKTFNTSGPRGLINELIHAENERHARVLVVGHIVEEMERNEDVLKDVGQSTRTAMGWFVAGTALLLLAAVVTALLEITGR